MCLMGLVCLAREGARGECGIRKRAVACEG